MTISVTERYDSRRLTDARDGRLSIIEVLYNVTGTQNEFKVASAVNETAPAVWGNGSITLYKQSVNVEVDPAGDGSLWTATVRYDTTNELVEGLDSLEFNTTGGSQNVTQSLSTVAAYPVGQAPNFQGAIGVSDTGVEGVDVVTPFITFSEGRKEQQLTQTEQQVIADTTGAINQFAFRGWEPGEVLFLGATARKENSQSSDPWLLTYEFGVQRNRANFYVGSILVTEKYGWDYLWIRYGVTAGSNELLRVPVAAYIERVYPVVDFSVLGIGA